MSFAGECTRVYTRRGHSAHLLAPEGTLRTGVLCGMAKRATAWLGTGSDEERAKAASLLLCEECEYQAWTEDEYRSEDAWGPAEPLGGFAAECARVYAPTGTVAHLCPPFTSSVLTAPLCGLDLAWPAQWLGTGSQREHEKAASLPLCGRCLYKANSGTRKFKAPAPAGAGPGGAEDHLAPAPDGGAPAAVRSALPARSPSGRRAAHPGPGPQPAGPGCAPSSPAGGSEGMPPAGHAPAPGESGAGAGEQVAWPPSRPAPGAGAGRDPGATAGVLPPHSGSTPAAEAPSPLPPVPGSGEGHAFLTARPAGGDGERGPGEPAGGRAGTPPGTPAGSGRAAPEPAGQSAAGRRAAQQRRDRQRPYGKLMTDRVTAALEKLGDGVTRLERRAAEARIADPAAPWAVIGEAAGVSGDAARVAMWRLVARADGRHLPRGIDRRANHHRKPADGRCPQCRYLTTAPGHEVACGDGGS